MSVYEVRLATGERVASYATRKQAYQAARRMRNHSALEVWRVTNDGVATFGIAVFPQLEVELQCRRQLDNWVLIHAQRDEELAAHGLTVSPFD